MVNYVVKLKSIPNFYCRNFCNGGDIYVEGVMVKMSRKDKIEDNFGLWVFKYAGIEHASQQRVKPIF